jgi:Bardet-Biedl syndrome 2 protein
LFVGSPTNLLAYDVERNADVFFKEVQDGVNTIKIGRTVSSRSKQMVFVGGNCSIVGFDRTGTEAFWTVVRNQCFHLFLAFPDPSIHFMHHSDWR